MRTVEDIFTSDTGFRNEAVETVSGFLLVSKHLVCLCHSDGRRSDAILVVAPELLKELLVQVPPLAGTMVAYAGRATVTGRLAKSGLAPLPYAFYQVRRLEFHGPGEIVFVYEREAA